MEDAATFLFMAACLCLPGWVLARMIIWLCNVVDSQSSKPETVDFEVKSTSFQNGHPIMVVQANNSEEVSRKMEHTTYRSGHFVIERTGEHEFTVRGSSE